MKKEPWMAGLLGLAGGGLMIVALSRMGTESGPESGSGVRVAVPAPTLEVTGERSEPRGIAATSGGKRDPASARAIAEAEVVTAEAAASAPAPKRSADEWVAALGLDRAERELRMDALAGGRWLLEAGSNPQVERVAEILRQAGVDEHALVTGIRDFHGHVQRLEQFHGFAHPTPEPGGDEGEGGVAAQGRDREPRRESPFPALFRSRLVEYEQYVRRDLAWVFGIRDPGVADRLFDVAYGRGFAAETPLAPVAEGGPGAVRDPTTSP